MNGLFKAASIFSFMGAVGFILVHLETGKFAFIGMVIVMLCNGFIFWKKSSERKHDVIHNEEKTED